MALINTDGGPVGWLSDLLSDGIGTGSPQDQIVAGLVLGAVIIATSAVGLIGTLLLLPIAFAMIGIGAIRLWSPVDNAYPL